MEVRYDNKKIELKGDAVNYTIENAANKKYTIGVVSFNEEGQSSESVYTDIRVGKTKVAFLGVTPTRDGITDDDEKLPLIGSLIIILRVSICHSMK